MRVGVGVVDDTKSFVEADCLVYKCLLDTQEATNLFYGVAIFWESRNVEFCLVGDDVLRHRVVVVVKGEHHRMCEIGSEFGILSQHHLRHNFHKIQFCIKMKTAVIQQQHDNKHCRNTIRKLNLGCCWDEIPDLFEWANFSVQFTPSPSLTHVIIHCVEQHKIPHSCSFWGQILYPWDLLFGIKKMLMYKTLNFYKNFDVVHYPHTYFCTIGHCYILSQIDRSFIQGTVHYWNTIYIDDLHYKLTARCTQQLLSFPMNCSNLNSCAKWSLLLLLSKTMKYMHSIWIVLQQKHPIQRCQCLLM